MEDLLFYQEEILLEKIRCPQGSLLGCFGCWHLLFLSSWSAEVFKARMLNDRYQLPKLQSRNLKKLTLGFFVGGSGMRSVSSLMSDIKGKLV